MKKGYVRLKKTDEAKKLTEDLNQYTVRHLAKELSMSTSTINKVVNYRRVMRSTMERLAQFLNVDVIMISESA